MNINEKQISSVLALNGEGRYEHFIKTIVDMQEAWGLYDNGWALAGTDDGQTIFPLWPAFEYAQLCANGDWLGYKPRAISLDDLTDQLLPKLIKDGFLAGIFYTPENKGVTPKIDEFLKAIDLEKQKY